MRLLSLTILAGILTAIGAAFAFISWHHWQRFRARRHPLSVVVALLPVGWAVACALALAADSTLLRSVVIAAAALEGAGGAYLVHLTRARESEKLELEARVRKLQEEKRRGKRW